MVGGVGFVPVSALAGAVDAFALHEGWPSIHPAWFFLSGVAGVVFASFALAFSDVLRLDDNPHRRRLAESDAWRRARDALARTAYLLTPDGFVALSFDPDRGGRLVRDEVLASSMTKVVVDEVGDGHVTVTVDGLLGRVTMAWLPRTRDLLDVVASWSPKDDAAYLDGPQ